MTLLRFGRIVKTVLYMAEIKPQIETFAKIKVVGVGGSGGSSTNRMIASKIRGVEFIAMNTDVQALHSSLAPQKLHIGKSMTRGLGAGMDPDVGYKAAEESQNEIREMLKGADMVFITCGMGGGTGTGASPFIASVAKEVGALVVAVVTKPFSFEGAARRAIAEAGHEKLASQVDTIITIPNDRILQIIDRKTSLVDAFEMVDDVLRQGVQGISEIITVNGMINVDFADVRAIMSNRGSALMGIGRGHGDNRAADAAKAAIASPLLEVSIDGAKGILFTITGGSNLGMYEVSEAAKVITQSADPQAKVIFGAIIDEALKDEVKITVVATGFDAGRGPVPAKPKTVLTGGTLPSASASSQAPTGVAPSVAASAPQQAPAVQRFYQASSPNSAPQAPQSAAEPLEKFPLAPTRVFAPAATQSSQQAPIAPSTQPMHVSSAPVHEPARESAPAMYASEPAPSTEFVEDRRHVPPGFVQSQPASVHPMTHREPAPVASPAPMPVNHAPVQAPAARPAPAPVGFAKKTTQPTVPEEEGLEIPAFIRKKMM